MIYKFIALLFTLTIIFQSALAEEFTKFDDTKINLVDLDGMFVNDKCKNNSQSCFKTLMALKKMPKAFKQNEEQKGHPASDYCKSLKGKNEIFRDKNNNEWDFCELKTGIVIDSWALYKRFKE